MITVDKERLITAMEEQGSIGNTGRAGELNRPAPSDEMKDVYDWFITQLEDAELDVWVDKIGNVFGRREGANPDLSPILVGSHLDSHHCGGIYDGALGVISALEVVRTLNDDGIDTNRPIEIVCWFNEEGTRYRPAHMGSKVWSGLIDLESAYSKVDNDGVKLEDELERVGYKGDEGEVERGPVRRLIGYV